jgi:hypothetical protein
MNAESFAIGFVEEMFATGRGALVLKRAIERMRQVRDGETT